MNRWYRWGAAGLTAAGLLSGCGSSSGVTSESSAATSTSAAAATTTTATPTTEAAATTPAAAATTTVAAATTTTTAAAGVTLDAPAEVAAGAKFDVKWTGPADEGDYITIVAAGASAWTNEPYFYTSSGPSPGALVAPIEDGAYAIWYVSGADDTIMARRAIQVTPFEGALGGPEEVTAGTSFDVAWVGPNGPGDYVTIVAPDATQWTGEPYFYTADANPGSLVAPLDAGEYVLWYVTGSDSATMASRPIKVTPYTVNLAAPGSVKRGTQFEVHWTGPNGPSDYITIVPAGSAPGTYLSYAYTNAGSPASLTAPDTAGNYEIWYASDRVQNVVFAKIPIVVT
ncbi:MAG TPA: hypothetical protein VH761_04040 [Ilumatobacteraceae bacterium]